MAERRKRGLGRGLGALINSDADGNPVAGAAVHAVPPVEPVVEAEPVDVSREKQEMNRPIDVFFTAKTHAQTQRVSRETPSVSAGTTVTMPKRATTSPRRGVGSRRAEMPNVLGPQSTPSRADRADADSQTDEISRETASSPQGAEFLDVPVEQIRPNPRQPREVFDEEDMAELVHSVREVGVLQPIVVRPIDSEHFELIMGERRWRASELAGRQTVPAVVRHTSDADLLRDALLENIHRSQLNPLEEAAAYQQLLDDFGISQEQLAERIGRSRPQISNTLRLMRLPAPVQRRVAAGVLSSGHARALLSLEDEVQMEDLAQRIVAEGLSVRSAEEQASLIKSDRQNEQVSRETGRLPSRTRIQELDDYAEALTDRLDTQVKISLGAKKGRIAIDFASLEDLERILEQMGAYVQR